MRALLKKAAIVTGAGSGIGRAIARRFAASGADLLLADISDQVEQTVKLIEEAGGSASFLRLDAGKRADVETLISTAEQRLGRLDILVANAGISGGLGSIFEQDEADWSEVLRVNLIGAFLAIKHGAPVIKRQGGGSIICTASVAALRSGAGSPAYSASKAGVVNLVQVAAQQLATTGIRVNAICPGLIETGMTDMIFNAARDAGKGDRLGRLNPLRRPGQPGEIAEAALFLASDASSYVNGHALVVDGGLSSSHPVARQDFGRTAC